MKLDKKDVLSNADIISIVGKRVALKRKGKELVGLCPFHKEKNPSFTVDKRGFYKCFGCGEGGDVADFIMKYEDCNFAKALEIIANDTGSTPMFTPPKLQEAPPPNPQLSPVPDIAPPASFVHDRWGNPSEVYTYTDIYGRITGHKVRFDPPFAAPNESVTKKQILPLTYRQTGGWKWIGFDKPRPIYGLDILHKRKSQTVIIVEGEKAVNAIQPLLSQSAVISWDGGVDGAKHVDWSPLQGAANVILWPDNDYTHKYGDKHKLAGQVKPWHEQPGNKVMLEIAELIKPFVGIIYWIKNSEGLPCGWDCADRKWTYEELRDYILHNRGEIPAVKPQNALPEIVKTESLPFRPLGFKKEGDTPKFCFFANSSKTVVTLSAAAMSKQNLINLAPLNYWEDHYSLGKGSRSSFNVEAASQFLIESCLERGIFNESLIRGRGAWIDNKRVVLHAGDKLIIDGAEYDLNSAQTKYVYERGLPLDFSVENPLETQLSQQLINMLQLVSWSRPINAYLLAGWCVIAPVCGALSWRPHIWVSGPAGTGKSWILKEIVRPLLGETAVAVQSSATEPGLRAMLGSDALPVIFDEAEGEHQGAQDRIRQVIELMRAASSDNSGVIPKGSAGGGKANITRIRSVFCFSSIVPQASQQADRSRLTMLELKKESSPVKREQSFEKLVEMHAHLINEDFIRGLHARTLKLLPVIVHNSDMFNRAAAAVLGEKRYGDQLGPMLAGAYSLCSEHKISFEDAKMFVGDPNQDWTEETSLDGNRDELRLFNYLMEQVIELQSDSGRIRRSIGELCHKCSFGDGTSITSLTFANADSELRRMGIKVESGFIIVSNQHDGVKRLLRNTPWSGGNHGKVLVRIDGAKKYAATTFAPGGSKSNAVGVPVEMIL